MEEELVFSVVDPARKSRDLEDIRSLLAASDLDLDDGIERFVTCRAGRRLVACGGLSGDVVKCVAIDESRRGDALCLKLVNEIVHLAMDMGRSHLFLYTKPGNVTLFEGCGFRKLVEVPGFAALMENTPLGIRALCDRLRQTQQPGARIGAIVLNANPFTLGHRHLVTTALADCDWLHVFVVGEDVSAIAYQDRFELVKAGLEGLERLTLHPGNRYLVSKATFPSYFIKDNCIVEACSTALDLLMFRQHLGPALGVTHRYVGTEPFCRLTRKYNEDMHHWLETHPCEEPAIQVVEVPRLAIGGEAISASAVRRLLLQGDFEAMARLVPEATLACMRQKYAPSLGMQA